VIAVDSNILIYAHRRDSPDHMRKTITSIGLGLFLLHQVPSGAHAQGQQIHEALLRQLL
jgi:hypothetical protein